MKRLRVITILLFFLLIFPVVSPVAAHAVDIQEYSQIRSCRVYIVAVSSSGEGVVGNLTVKVAYPGSGKVYISTSPASMVDTQGSARIAAFAASLLAGIDMTKFDFFYDIESNSIIVGGPSAGFAMTLATLLALENQTCRSTFAVTGMIQPDTSIGPVGGLKEKLEAAASVGAKLFMIPAGQEVYTYYQTKYVRIGPFVYVEKKPVTVNLTEYGEELGVKVVSVASLDEAFRILTNKTLAYYSPKALHPQLPVVESLEDFVKNANRTVDKIINSVENDDSRFIRSSIENATKNIDEAFRLLDEGNLYPSALKAVDALTYVYQAKYADIALSKSLDVTEVVADVNTSISSVYEILTKYSTQTNTTPVSVETLAKAWAKMGIATFYYQQAVDSLDREGDSFYLPRTLFGGVVVTPIKLLATAKGLAIWSLFWANLSQNIEELGQNVVEHEALVEVARLLLAEARSTTAYLQTLLEEAGADTGNARLPAFLVELALTTSNPIAVIGYSIESVSLTTAAIHDTFTLAPERTALELQKVAISLYERANYSSIQIPLLLQLSNTSTQSKAEVLATSHAILYGWLTWILSIGGGEATTPHPPQQTTPMSKPQTIGKKETAPEPMNTGEAAVHPIYALVFVLTALLGIIIGVIVGSLASRR